MLKCFVLPSLLLATILSAISTPSQKHDTLDPPLVWDVSRFDRMDEDVSLRGELKYILKYGGSLRKAPPIVITDKMPIFSPDKHYYVSVSSYWWPDSLDNRRYVNKDGYVNPYSQEFDRKVLSSFATRCKTLGKAFYITRDTSYYNAFIRQLRAWFIDENTYMYPSFEYASIVPGQHNKKGRSAGLVESYSFNPVIESIRLVNMVKEIDTLTLNSLRSWFTEFIDWTEGTYGKDMLKSNTNTSMAYDVTLINMYLFVGDEKKAKEVADRFEKTRINVQLLEDGRQPVELNRTKAFSYSVFNLTHVIDYCYLVRYWYPAYYKNHRDRIDKAFSFLSQYVDNPSLFPYQQITIWDVCKKDFMNLQERRDALLLD